MADTFRLLTGPCIILFGVGLFLLSLIVVRPLDYMMSVALRFRKSGWILVVQLDEHWLAWNLDGRRQQSPI